MKRTLFLCLDQGGHASRAIVFDAAGEILAQAFVPIGTHRTPEGYVEHDAEDLLESLDTALADVDRQIEPDAIVECTGLATQRSSIVCWDRTTGAALSPVISWQDRRHATFVDTLKPRAAAIHERTGLVLSPHYGASKMRWCLDHLPLVRAAADDGRLALGPLSSFILFRLLRERPFLVDPANASRTQLWDPSTRQWAEDLLELFGVARQHLPEPVTSRYAFGSLQLGERSIPLGVCTGDQSTVPYAFGPADLSTAYVNLGTGAFIQCPLAEPLRVRPLLTSVVWADAGSVVYALEGSVNGAASAFDWLGETEGVDAHRMLSALTPAAAHGIPPLLFLNGVSGLGSPFWIANFASRFVGRGTIEAKLLAVLESILFLIRVNLDEMRTRHSTLERIVVTGGLSASDVLCQRLADLTALPVIRPAEREATARGLAFLTAGQPSSWGTPADARRFEAERDTALLERFFAWLKEMKRASSG